MTCKRLILLFNGQTAGQNNVKGLLHNLVRQPLLFAVNFAKCLFEHIALRALGDRSCDQVEGGAATVGVMIQAAVA